MPAPDLRRYRLTPKALSDLEDIWRYSANTWSPDQTDVYIDELSNRFEMIAAAPDMARERTEFTPPVRIHSHRRHLIVYTVEEEEVVVLRLLGGAQNWQAILSALD
ncbi:type II toxin-antitoxin system RelE/ParE family toxin [Roseibium litorale]|uniref:Toxin n=1 Tax=Roseibium litorale TaxID=2803841 RepID=A0ABR9CLK3_9HYPH|nr:type II toxin-antitoxin system RelE/ParE family toxin [Roseibium litorale]MBD8891549.1 type II toxin-antitoxin system RelE/ParE family toxin [Roseibium litorale]